MARGSHLVGMRCDISRLVPTCMLREGLTRGERKSSCWDGGCS